MYFEELEAALKEAFKDPEINDSCEGQVNAVTIRPEHRTTILDAYNSAHHWAMWSGYVVVTFNGLDESECQPVLLFFDKVANTVSVYPENLRYEWCLADGKNLTSQTTIPSATTEWDGSCLTDTAPHYIN